MAMAHDVDCRFCFTPLDARVTTVIKETNVADRKGEETCMYYCKQTNKKTQRLHTSMRREGGGQESGEHYTEREREKQGKKRRNIKGK